MGGLASGLAEFAARLRGCRVAIVYSHCAEGAPEERWYHRWRTNVVAMFSQAIEHCGAIAVFFDLDQWIEHCARPRSKIDYLVNLNAGNRSLDQWGIAPALAEWAGIPVFPCSAFTVMLGEAKDVSKIIARSHGWKTARAPNEGLTEGDLVVRKPRSFGSSVDLERGPLKTMEPRSGDWIIEEFVPGYDATIVSFYAAVTNSFECHGAQSIIPETTSPESWMYDAFEKRHTGERTKIDFRQCPVSAELARKSVELTQSLGSRFVSRIDVRVSRKPTPSTPIEFADCTFLEINPMPTIGPRNSVTEFAARYVEQNVAHDDLGWLSKIAADRIERAAAYILSCGLMVVSSK